MAVIAHEVCEVLTENGCKVFGWSVTIRLIKVFLLKGQYATMRATIKNSRDLIVPYT